MFHVIKETKFSVDLNERLINETKTYQTFVRNTKSFYCLQLYLVEILSVDLVSSQRDAWPFLAFSGGSWCRADRGGAVLGRRKADLWNVGESCEEGPPGRVGV